MRNSNPAADLVENGLEKKSLHSFSHIRYLPYPYILAGSVRSTEELISPKLFVL